MATTVTATELKNRAGQVIEQAQHEDVIVSRQGRPYVVVVAWKEYRQLQEWRAQQVLRRHRLTPERWQAIQAELKAVSTRGEQDTDLAEFVTEDRSRR